MKLLLLLLLLFCFSFASFAEEATPQPEPYSPDEFSPLLKDIRRFEIILIGSLPFTFFFSSLSYQLYRYISFNFDKAYAPVLFGGVPGAGLMSQEKEGIIWGSLSVSAAMALADFIIGKIVEKKEH